MGRLHSRMCPPASDAPRNVSGACAADVQAGRCRGRGTVVRIRGWRTGPVRPFAAQDLFAACWASRRSRRLPAGLQPLLARRTSVESTLEEVSQNNKPTTLTDWIGELKNNKDSLDPVLFKPLLQWLETK